GDLLRFQALLLLHVEKVGVATYVDLIRPVHSNGPVGAEPGEGPVDDGRADHSFHVVAYYWQPLLREPPPPGLVRSYEHGDAIDESDTRLKRDLSPELGSLLAPHGKIVNEQLGLCSVQVAQDLVAHLGDGPPALDGLDLLPNIDPHAVEDR